MPAHSAAPPPAPAGTWKDRPWAHATQMLDKLNFLDTYSAARLGVEVT
jgi:hypothetical protein